MVAIPVPDKGTPDAMEAAVRGVGLKPVFQPIVSLRDESVIGFEALARWPRLGPNAVFEYARSHGYVDLLDQACVDGSIDTALRSTLPADTLLSVNCEPASSYRTAAGHQALSRAKERFQVIFEITERSMLRHPHALLEKVSALRADGFLIALDDVGAHPDSSALLDVISPDVVKLDLALVQSQPNFLQAQTLSAVLAHCERTGAVILAEGIETDEHFEQALALGADLGQGYRFGAPGNLVDNATIQPWSTAHHRQSKPTPTAGSPFGLIEGRHRLRTARKATVAAFSRHIEIQASRAADPPIVLATLQRSEHLTPRTMSRYRDLAERSALVAVFGERMPAQPAIGIRGITLQSTDPLCSEWTVVTIGPQTSAALIAREHPGNQADTPDSDRRFEFVITYDRDLVTAAARNLLGRIGAP
jgi:EAL domain-containing protein (putative c-di-GMP-specific phosphodiesterase class I)